MKLTIIVLGIIILAVSIFADYKWHKWMTTRKREHDGPSNHRY
jgi:hypothetical protein